MDRGGHRMTRSTTSCSTLTLKERLGIKSEIIKRSIEQLDFDLRVCSPGIIETYDPVTMTATVTVAVKEAIQLSGIPSTIQIPIIPDVPVIFIGGGDWLITTPIKHGDECLLFFSDTCIDSWWESGCIEPFDEGSGFVAAEPVCLRRHDLSDAFCLVGPFSHPKMLSAPFGWHTGYSYSVGDVCEYQGKAYVSISSITNSVQSPQDDKNNFREIVNPISTDSLQIRNKEGTTMIELKDDVINFIGQVNFESNSGAQTGWSGSFTSQTGLVITVQNGIIIGAQK